MLKCPPPVKKMYYDKKITYISYWFSAKSNVLPIAVPCYGYY